MITLNDAFERARLASDDSGMLSSVTYDMICQQLSDAEKYAFTVGLVDLGIQTRRGSVETTGIVAKVLGKTVEGLDNTVKSPWDSFGEED